MIVKVITSTLYIFLFSKSFTAQAKIEKEENLNKKYAVKVFTSQTLNYQFKMDKNCLIQKVMRKSDDDGDGNKNNDSDSNGDGDENKNENGNEDEDENVNRNRNE